LSRTKRSTVLYKIIFPCLSRHIKSPTITLPSIICICKISSGSHGNFYNVTCDVCTWRVERSNRMPYPQRYVHRPGSVSETLWLALSLLLSSCSAGLSWPILRYSFEIFLRYGIFCIL
jgi:hypothetical protein